MLKTLIAFGCSFTYGDELLDPNIKSGELCNSRHNDDYRNSHCYAGIVADHYGLELINTAFPGGSLESMRYALYWASKNCDLQSTLLIAGLTQAHRTSYFDQNLTDNLPWNRFQHSTWLKNNNEDEWSRLNSFWQKMCLSHEWEKFNLYQTIKVFESASSNLVLLPVFNDEPDFQSLFKTDFVVESILNDTDYAVNGHPNENGHNKIANRLIKHIESAKLYRCLIS